MPDPRPSNPTPPRRRSGAPEIPELLREDRPLPETPAQRRARLRAERRRSPEWRAIGIGVDFGAMVAAGCLLGYGVDVWRGSWPLGTVIGGALGTISGGYTALRMALKLNRDMDAYERSRRREGAERPGEARGR